MRALRYRCCGFLFALIPAGAWAGDLPAKFTLGRYVPGDVWMYVHGVDNPERAWLDERISALIQSAIDAGIHRDTVGLIISIMPEDMRPKAQEIADRVLDLTEKVNWLDFFRHEFVFAERFTQGNFGAEYLALGRGEPAEVKKNLEVFSSILEEISRHNRNFDFVRAVNHGVEVRSLRMRTTGAELSVPFVSVVQKGDVLGIVASMADEGGRGGTMLREVRSLLGGGTNGKSIVSSERFRRAVAEVESPSDAIVFFDTHTFLNSMGGTFKRLRQRLMDDPNEAAGLECMCKAVEALNVLDYTITSESTRGGRSVSSSMMRIQPGKETSPLMRAFIDRTPFTKFDQFIPADATSFTMDTCVDLEILYRWALDFVAQDLPNGPALLQKYKGIIAGIGFDPQRDLFSWWSGEFVSVSMPAAAVTPFGGGDSVWMVRVKNPQVASAKITAGIDFINAMLQARGQSLMVSPAPVQAEGFRQVSWPPMAMVMRPVFGVKDNWLIAGSSAQAVDKCLAVAAGKAQSIVTNERFAKEGIKSDGPVYSLSFTDASKTGQELGQGAAMIGMMAGGIAASLPGEVPAEARSLIKGSTQIISNLAPILQRIDFYSSKSSVSRYDGAGGLRCESVVTYKMTAAEAQVRSKDPAK